MNRIAKIVGLICGLLLVVAAGVAAQMPGVPDLTSEQLKQRLDQGEGIVVVDTRTRQEFNGGHIRGAINISSQDSHQFRTLARLLPRDKDTPLVFYCRGYN